MLFSLASAFQHNKQFGEAMAHFDKAHTQLALVRDELLAKGTDAAKEEAADLDAVIKDVAERKEDAKAEAAETKRAALAARAAARPQGKADEEAGGASSPFDSPFDAPLSAASAGKGKAPEGGAAAGAAPVHDLSTVCRVCVCVCVCACVCVCVCVGSRSSLCACRPSARRQSPPQFLQTAAARVPQSPRRQRQSNSVLPQSPFVKCPPSFASFCCLLCFDQSLHSAYALDPTPRTQHKKTRRFAQRERGVR